MDICLSSIEFALAWHAGWLIHEESKAAGLTDRMILPHGDPLLLDQIGQVGEMVVAKALDLYWGNSAFTFHAPDLSHNIEVRTIRRPDNGLKVRPVDAPGKRVVGVLLPDDLGTRQFAVVGWISASAGKRDEWAKNPYDAGVYYGVPLEELLPIEELQDIVNEERCYDHTTQNRKVPGGVLE